MTTVAELEQDLAAHKQKEAEHDVNDYRSFVALLARGEDLVPNQKAKLTKLLARLNLEIADLTGDVEIMKTAIGYEPFLATFDAEQDALYRERIAYTEEAKTLWQQYNAAENKRKSSENRSRLNLEQQRQIRQFEARNPRIFADPVTAAGCKDLAVGMNESTRDAQFNNR